MKLKHFTPQVVLTEEERKTAEALMGQLKEQGYIYLHPLTYNALRGPLMLIGRFGDWLMWKDATARDRACSRLNRFKVELAG